MTLKFSVDIQKKEPYPVIRVSGELDVYSCPELRKLLLSVEPGEHPIVINLEDTTYIDSTGLGTIASTARTLHAQDRKVFIVCTKSSILKVFEISGLDKKNVKLVSTLEEVKG